MTTPTSGLTWAAPLGTVADPITWAFAQPGSNVDGLAAVTNAISDPMQQAQVTAGIDRWSQVSGLQLREVANPSIADIQVGYGNPSNLLGQDLWSYDPQTSTYNDDLVLLGDPNSKGGLTVAANGQLTYSNNVTLEQLATHEFGAAIGLAEGNGSDSSSVMNHTLTSSNQVPDAADIAAADNLYGPPANPAPTVGPDQLTLLLSEDAWRGNAQFIVKVNGQTVGGPTVVTALHSQGATQAFTYNGNWGSGAQAVEIDFINDAYGGSASQDRNLYVDQVMYNGVVALNQSHPMYSNSAFMLTVGSSHPV